MFNHITNNLEQLGIGAIALIKLLLNILALLTGLATILGFFGSQWWIFEALDHPRIQYCLILAVALIIGGIYRQKWSFILGVPFALNLVVILPLFFHPNLPVSSNYIPLTILHANLDRDNLQYDRAIEYVSNQKADLIFLQEVTPAWLNKLNSNIKNYKLHTVLPLDNSLGVAMLVPISISQNIEIVTSQILYMPAYSPRPTIEVIVHRQGKKIAILSMSTARGTNSKGASSFQKTEFDEVAKWSMNQQQEHKREVIAIGDFNSTPWSGRFRQFQTDSNLINSQFGFGLQTTWPASLPSLFRIPIDHCLHSREIRTVERQIGSDIGSDHLPLLVKLL
jgi:endonuclease/exonuclease/phosphatase (EEP) superfamily protein YafD